MHTMRVLIECLIVGALVFGVISSILRKKKILALTGLFLITILGWYEKANKSLVLCRVNPG